MSENKSGFVPPGVDPWAGDREQRKGERERQAAIGSGPRAEEARKKAIEQAREEAEEAIERYNKEGQRPEDLEGVRRRIDVFRRLNKGGK